MMEDESCRRGAYLCVYFNNRQQSFMIFFLSGYAIGNSLGTPAHASTRLIAALGPSPIIPPAHFPTSPSSSTSMSTLSPRPPNRRRNVPLTLDLWDVFDGPMVLAVIVAVVAVVATVVVVECENVCARGGPSGGRACVPEQSIARR